MYCRASAAAREDEAWYSAIWVKQPSFCSEMTPYSLLIIGSFIKKHMKKLQLLHVSKQENKASEWQKIPSCEFLFKGMSCLSPAFLTIWILIYRVSEGKVFFFNLALRERNIQVRLYLKVVLKSWDVEILIIRINFWKSDIGWPQQPQTEKVQKLKNSFQTSKSSWIQQPGWLWSAQ